MTDLSHRIVRYGELEPCKTAFIDAHTPGSDQKENFTIIGGGVSAKAPISTSTSRSRIGFNIGAAGQPPKCRNSLHSHRTAEVFFVLSGRWRFFWGRWGDAGEVMLEKGDIINIPTGIFRGFENIGERLRNDHGDPWRRRRRRRRHLGTAGDRRRRKSRAGAGRKRQALRHQKGPEPCPTASPL